MMQPSVAPRSPRLERIAGIATSQAAAIAVILSLSLVFTITSWGKLPSLFYTDIGRWLNIVERFANGETAYRDYAWQYGPLPLIVMGSIMRVFGATFDTVQIMMDVQSAVIVVLAYLLARKTLPRNLHLAVMALFICTLATSTTYFSVFSLLTYSAASPGAAIGCLLLLLGGYSYLEGRRRSGFAVLAAGCWISLLTKQDAMVTAPAVVVLVLAIDYRLREPEVRQRWILHAVLACAVCFIPPGAVYLAFAAKSGFGLVLKNLDSFGLASHICPWWPTGFGLLGALGALGAGAAVMGLSMLPDSKRWRAYLGSRTSAFAVVAVAGAMIFAAYEWLDLRALFDDPASVPVWRLLRELLSTNTVFRPVQWFALCLCATLLWKLAPWKKRPISLVEAQLLLFTTVVALSSSRGWFSNAMGTTPEVPAVTHPFVLLLGPLLLLRWLERPYGITAAVPASGEKTPARVVILLSLAYAGIRLVGAYPELISDQKYSRLHTSAGDVKLKFGDEEIAIYNYIVSSTKSSDSILEIPMNGGLNFATKRRNPAYNSLFWENRPELWLLESELNRIRQDAPEVIVAEDAPRYGIYYGYPYRILCPCPRLVWVPDALAGDPDVVLPIEPYIREAYHADRKIGMWILLRRNRLTASN